MDQQIKINYQLRLDSIIGHITQTGKVPTLLLHSCCGPCSSYVVTYLMEYFRITVLYYNPNIYPEAEYDHRLSEQARLLKELGVPLLEIGYDHREFLDHVKGLEAEPEGGLRCRRCFELRLRRTRELAAEKGFDYFCTTLTVSPHKNAMVINQVGAGLAGVCEVENAGDADVCGGERPDGFGACGGERPGDAGSADSLSRKQPLWLPSDFKKREGYKRSIELSRQYDLYRQDYCGCEFAANMNSL